jgi:hypothetical protein
MKDKQSSVDLLWNLIPKDIQNMIEKQFDGYNKAKEIEKNQIMDARRNGSYKATEKYGETRTNIQYYNETYGGNK